MPSVSGVGLACGVVVVTSEARGQRFRRGASGAFDSGVRVEGLLCPAVDES